MLEVSGELRGTCPAPHERRVVCRHLSPQALLLLTQPRSKVLTWNPSFVHLPKEPPQALLHLNLITRASSLWTELSPHGPHQPQQEVPHWA
jgi:hypothetical protein